MSLNDQIDVFRGNIVNILNESEHGFFMSELYNRYFESTGTILYPDEFGFDSLETLLSVITGDLLQLDYDEVNVIVAPN